MDELKRYLQNNKEALDQDTPDPRVWQNIRLQNLAEKKPATIRLFTRWAIAACITLLTGTIAWLVLFESSGKSPVTVARKEGSLSSPVTEKVAEKITPAPEKPLIVKKETAVREKPVRQLPKKELAIESPNNSAVFLSQLENSFTQVINLQRDRVKSIPMFTETPAYFNDFKLQLHQMDKDEKAIKSTIARRGMNDDLLDQLINLYQQKLTILKQLQLEMNKTNNRFKQNSSPADSTKTYFLNI